MRIKKILLAFITFSVTAIVCALCAGAEIYSDYEYSVLDSDTVEIIDYNGSDTELDIPSEIDGKSVVSIGKNSFSYCSSLTAVAIPDSVKSIESSAFAYCFSLENITLSGSLESIGEYAFRGCSMLKSIVIPGSVTEIGDFAFLDCSGLTGIKIPDGVTSIGNDVFSYCTSLASITIPDSVESIGDWAFECCESLKAITIPSGVKSIGKYAFYGCSSLTDMTLPVGVQIISSGAFEYCFSLENITIPDGVKSIESNAFNGCISLVSIKIPDGVTSIGYNAFYKCSLLESVTIPDSVQSIGDYAFSECSALLKILCYYGTAAEKYAIDNSIAYKLLDECTEHTYGAWTTTKTATCTATGTKTRACTKCGAKETQTIPATGHKYITTVVKPTYTAQGYTLHKCSICGYSYKDSYTDKLTLPGVSGLVLGGRAADALRLNWTKNASADGYIIEQYTGGKWVRIARIAGNSTTTYRIAGLKGSTAYKFRMKAYKNGSPAIYSSYTSTLVASTNPNKVSGLKLGGRAADALRLNWAKNEAAGGFIIEQYTGVKWVRIARIAGNATTTYRVTGLKGSTAYKFRMKAYKMDGSIALYSGYTELSATTNPYAVSGLKIGGQAKNALRINWSKNTSAGGYIAEMYSGGKWVRIARISGNSTLTYRKAGLKANTTYKFRVRAYHMVGKTALYGNYAYVNGTTLK